MKSRIPVAAVLGLLVLAGCATSAETLPGQQISQTFERPVLVSGQYLLYLPESYEQQAGWPLLLFLHGAGERGDDLEKVKIHGPPKLVEAGQDMPFIVVSPQVPESQRWSVTMLDGVLQEVVANYNVDADRIYVTGLSMGGFGTWDLAMAFPNRFAAIAPICGGGASHNACAIKDVPVWNFHGAKDTVVPIERSQEMVDALEKCGGDVRFTVYPEAGHDAWTETYDNPELYDWLLQHRRGE
ncbi:MAG TPA: prolyl oligopeptidase family serine peptidase [Rhodothermales bacterium]|nr:prolyl oligopeptidase family serine peptidase [Rhodothermales bacterium]